MKYTSRFPSDFGIIGKESRCAMCWATNPYPHSRLKHPFSQPKEVLTTLSLHLSLHPEMALRWRNPPHIASRSLPRHLAWPVQCCIMKALPAYRNSRQSDGTLPAPESLSPAPHGIGRSIRCHCHPPWYLSSILVQTPEESKPDHLRTGFEMIAYFQKHAFRIIERQFALWKEGADGILKSMCLQRISELLNFLITVSPLIPAW